MHGEKKGSERSKEGVIAGERRELNPNEATAKEIFGLFKFIQYIKLF
jgi:hypothetical protein